jgi:hypothetical protein
MIFQKLEKIRDFEDLKKEVNSVIDQYGSSNIQIMCQNIGKEVDDWQEGIGRLDLLDVKEEEKYSFINPSIRGSLIEKYILHYGGFRSRIMIMNGRSCYSVHRDFTKRIHIPIETNQHAWMIWPKNSICLHLEEGYSYLVDTTKDHAYMNGSDDKRIHLMMCVK